MSQTTRLFIRISLAFVLVAVLVGGFTSRVQAVVIDRDGVIPAGETIDDDVVMGATFITVDGTVNGTLIAAGQTVTINGTIHGDVIAASQTVVIGEKAVIDGNLFVGASAVQVRGKINGSIFGAGASIAMDGSASVSRNVYFAGYSLQSKSGSKIARDLYGAGYQFDLGGTTRNLVLAGVAAEISGVVEGNAQITLGTSEWNGVDPTFTWGRGVEMPTQMRPGLRIKEGATINGKLTYTSSVDFSSSIESAPKGGVVYQTPVPSETRKNRPSIEPFITRTSDIWGGFWLWGMLRNLATILVLGALALWLVPSIFQRTLTQLRGRSLASMAVGLLALVVALFAIPVVAIALVMLSILFGLTTLFDLAGIIAMLGFGVFGLAVSVFFILFAWAGKLLVSYFIGKWTIEKLSPQARPHWFWQLALGAVIFALLAAIPLAGFLLTFLVDLAGIGALWYAWRSRAV